MEKNEWFAAFRVWVHYPDGVKMADEIYGLSQDKEAREAASKICQGQGVVTEVRLHSSSLPIDHDEQWRSLYKGRPLNDRVVAQEIDAALREDSRGEYVYVYWPAGQQFDGNTGKTARQVLAEGREIVVNFGSGAFCWDDLISSPSYAEMTVEEAEADAWGGRLTA